MATSNLAARLGILKLFLPRFSRLLYRRTQAQSANVPRFSTYRSCQQPAVPALSLELVEGLVKAVRPQLEKDFKLLTRGTDLVKQSPRRNTGL